MKDRLYVIHIIECIDHINSYVVDGFESFKNDHKTYDAVLRQLQIMSESTKRLSEEIKKKNNQIAWREIAGFRNILVHDYLGDIDAQIVWAIITDELPKLKVAMQEELKIL
jgi:uncharacterized protein with HEPN domain